jgi:DNA polymerase elongation subunit (family B)
MGRITPSFRQLYEETISDMRSELQAALVDLNHKSAFDLLLKEAWNPEQADMGNSTLPTVSDKLNVMASIHNRKLIAILTKGLKEKAHEIEELKQQVSSLEDRVNDLYLIIKNKEQLQRQETELNNDLISNDRGGMIISPQTGLHENVMVLDYDNEYANLIVNHNLSYETVIPDNKTRRGGANKGLLPTIVEKFLQRRLHFEATSNGLHTESKEYLWCQQRIDSLKNILVCLYGTTGSIWNRYGNVRVFEEINRLSREILIKTKDVVQKLDCELIYADTDSIFIKNPDGVASTNQYEKIVSILQRETGLPISVEHNFRFLVLLPLEANEKIEALKQYYGITHEGQLVVRGVEIRRHDTPKFIKEFQTELLSALFDCNDVKEITNKGYESALMLVTRAIDKIMIGGDGITLDDLIIHKLLGQDIKNTEVYFLMLVQLFS